MHAGTSDDAWANCEEIYFDCLPTLVLPDATARWAGCSLRLTRHDEDGGNDQVVFERVLDDLAITDGRIPLVQDETGLLNTWGRYSVRIRGRLRLDVCLRFICLPSLHIDYTLDDFLPEREKGSRDVRLVLTCAQPVSIDGIPDTTCTPLDSTSTRYEVRVPADCRVAHLRINPAEGVQIPVSIKIPRVEWAIYDEGRPTKLEFTDKAIDVDWQDLDNWREPKLYIRCGFEPTPRLSLDLEDGHQTEQPDHDGNGKYAIKLRRWSSTMETLGRSVSTLKLHIDFETPESGDAKTYELAVVRFLKEWIVDGEPMVCTSDGSDGCWIELAWRERSILKNRILRLWATDGSLADERQVPDGESSAILKLKDRSDAKYRLEFTLQDDWNDPQVPHNLYKKNIRELIIRDGQVECLSREGQLEALLLAVADGREVSESELTQVLEDTANDTYATECFCEAFCEAVFQRCAARKDFAYASRAIDWIVQRSERGEVLERVAEAVLRLAQRNPEIRPFFVALLVDLGILGQFWGQSMRELIASGIGGSSDLNSSMVSTASLKKHQGETVDDAKRD